MDPAPPPTINEALLNDILAMIFEEHARLEWKAPAVDGRVCRLWRRLVLVTPRAWSYLHINICELATAELRLWLNRSRAAPLHITVDTGRALDGHPNKPKFNDLLSNCHARITSLRMDRGDPSFFEGQGFPCLTLLDIRKWPNAAVRLPINWWSPMPKLRSLHLGFTDLPLVALNNLAHLEVLVLYKRTIPSIPQHLPSLTTLMLENVSFPDTISGPFDFPSLTFLSLYGVRGFKRYINAPNLVTYHEGDIHTISESFSAPLPSVAEYGRYGSHLGDELRWWPHFFPNVSKIAIRASAHVTVSLLDHLSNYLSSLPGLQTISVASQNGAGFAFTCQEKKVVENVRSKEIFHMLHFEERPFLRIPLFFGEVSFLPIR